MLYHLQVSVEGRVPASRGHMKVRLIALATLVLILGSVPGPCQQADPQMKVFTVEEPIRDVTSKGLVWAIETAAEGCNPSLVFDSAGRPRIAFSADTPYHYAAYAYYDGTTWHVEPVDPAGGSGMGGKSNGIGLDETGSPVIAYFSEDWKLKYATRDDDTWRLSTLDATHNAGTFIDLAMDESHHPHISYSIYLSTIMYCYHNGTAWSKRTLVPATDAKGYNAIAIDVHGYPHVSYYSKTGNGSLGHVYQDESGWHKEIVDQTAAGGVGEAPSIAIDSDGFCHISYYDSFEGYVKYAKQTASGWSIEVVASGIDEGTGTGIDCDSGGNPHIAYADIASEDLYYAFRDSEEWHCQVVDTNRVSYYDTESAKLDLRVDTEDIPHIVYSCYATQSIREVRHAYLYDPTADHTPPTPDPMTWRTAPYATSTTSVSMTATTADDISGVEYYFEETSGNPGGTDSGWQESPMYSDSGLATGQDYCYRVRARDKSPNQNATFWSTAECDTTAIEPYPEEAPDLEWVRFLRVDEAPYEGWPRLYDVVLDTEGNAYAVAQIDWQESGWAGVVWIGKWSQNGELLWNKTYDQPDIRLHPRAACIDDGGNVFVVGIHSARTPPSWFILRLDSSGTLQNVWTINDGDYKCLRSIDIHPSGDLLVCGDYWSEDGWVGRFSWEAGSWTWEHVYAITPPTHHDFAIGTIGALDPANDVYYFGKNVDLGTSKETVILKVSAADGSLQSFTSFDFATGSQEMPSALGVDSEGNLLGLVWHVGDDHGTIFKLDLELNPLWTYLVEGKEPYLFLRDLDIGLDGTVYVVGCEGENEDWDLASENSHMFTMALSSSGEYLWRHTFDVGGLDEKEGGSGNGIAISPDGSRVVAGGDLAFSETDWVRSLALLSYGKTFVDTSAVFRVEAQTGDLHSDGTVWADSFVTGSADVAEWVSVARPVERGDVLEFDPSATGGYRRSEEPCSQLIGGIVSTRPGITLGATGGETQQALLALIGIVPVKVTNEGGPIEPGDLLVSSSTPGHAMRWAGPDPCPCALVGKALEPMTEETGVILVLLTAH